MLVSELMTRELVTVHAETSLAKAVELMDSRDRRHLLVVARGDARKLVGILSDRDLLAAPDGVRDVSELMHRSVRTLPPEANVVTAALEMSLQKIGCLPIVSEAGLVGLLSEVDLMTAFQSLCGDSAHLDQNPTVTSRMIRDVHTLAGTATLLEAAELCRRHDIRHVPVVDDGALVGVLSDRDLRRARGRKLPPDTPVFQLIEARPITIAPDDRLATAAERMVSHHISCLPVCPEESRHLVGILTSNDLLDHCLDNLRED